VDALSVLAMPGDGIQMSPATRVVTGVSWAFAPEWLTLEEASYLSGHDAANMHWLIHDVGVEAKRQGDTWLIEKASLREFQEILLELAQSGLWD